VAVRSFGLEGVVDALVSLCCSHDSVSFHKAAEGCTVLHITVILAGLTPENWQENRRRF